MSDPRFDPRLSDPVERRPDTSGGMWGWIAGIAVVVLIAIILIAGWNSNTASNESGATTTGSAPMSSPMLPRPATPPSTTGSAPNSAPMSPTAPPAPSRP